MSPSEPIDSSLQCSLCLWCFFTSRHEENSGENSEHLRVCFGGKRWNLKVFEYRHSNASQLSVNTSAQPVFSQPGLNLTHHHKKNIHEVFSGSTHEQPPGNCSTRLTEPTLSSAPLCVRCDAARGKFKLDKYLKPCGIICSMKAGITNWNDKNTADMWLDEIN